MFKTVSKEEGMWLEDPTPLLWLSPIISQLLKFNYGWSMYINTRLLVM
jgi:hypothetical protein